MNDEITHRHFEVVMAHDCPSGSFDLLIGFSGIADAELIAKWSVMLHRTFIALTMAGGTGGNVVAPHQTHLRLIDQKSAVINNRTFARWEFDDVAFSNSALLILSNLIQNGSYNIATSDAAAGTAIDDIMFDSKSFHGLSNIEQLAFPKAWHSLPFAVEDFQPESTDFDIEVEYVNAPRPDLVQQLRMHIVAWVCILDGGGFWGIRCTHGGPDVTPVSLFFKSQQTH